MDRQNHQHQSQTGSAQETPRQNTNMAPTTSPTRQHSEDSWVEIGSGPSSSSLSSIADHEIITTGLRVQHDSNNHRRRRRSHTTGQFHVGTGYRVTTPGGDNSSQDEYDESESESDRVMTSSNEGIGPSPLRNETRLRGPYSSSDTMSEREDEDDDENATAVNYPRSSRRHFEPRPNAFSHPATQHAVRPHTGTAYTPRRPTSRSQSQRHSYPSHSPFNVISPSAQAEHDEVLRASLSTLLSAAAAVRGLPKPGQARTVMPNNSSRIDPASLRLVPESVALSGIPEEATSYVASDDVATSSSPHTVSTGPSVKSKRKAGPPVTTSTHSSSKDRHAIKKVRKVGPLVEEISPTLFTWVLSASVLAIVGVVSFSTGYSMGKEAGHAEAVGQLGATGNCSKEAATGIRGAGMGLKRLRWTGGSGVRV